MLLHGLTGITLSAAAAFMTLLNTSKYVRIEDCAASAAMSFAIHSKMSVTFSARIGRSPKCG
jgi:hypothetical protein